MTLNRFLFILILFIFYIFRTLHFILQIFETSQFLKRENITNVARKYTFDIWLMFMQKKTIVVQFSVAFWTLYYSCIYTYILKTHNYSNEDDEGLGKKKCSLPYCLFFIIQVSIIRHHLFELFHFHRDYSNLFVTFAVFCCFCFVSFPFRLWVKIQNLH